MEKKASLNDLLGYMMDLEKHENLVDPVAKSSETRVEQEPPVDLFEIDQTGLTQIYGKNSAHWALFRRNLSESEKEVERIKWLKFGYPENSKFFNMPG